MKLMDGKVRLFSISNLAVSFMITSFMGVTYCNNHDNLVSIANENQTVETEVEPLSQLGDEGTKEETTQKEVVVKKQTTTKKKVTNVVKKKEVASKVTYAPAKYSSVTGNAIVDYAKRYLGLRYVGGGYSLTSGTDCSGFTKLIYQEFGVTLSRSVSGQIGNGTFVRKGDLQKGDLVFYGKTSGRATHVAIYIGNGQVIHESNHRDGVKISSVNMMHYITARRVINSKSIKIVEDKIAQDKKSEESGTPSIADNNVVSDNANENVAQENVKIEENNNIENVSENTTSASDNSNTSTTTTNQSKETVVNEETPVSSNNENMEENQ